MNIITLNFRGVTEKGVVAHCKTLITSQNVSLFAILEPSISDNKAVGWHIIGYA